MSRRLRPRCPRPRCSFERPASPASERHEGAPAATEQGVHGGIDDEVERAAVLDDTAAEALLEVGDAGRRAAPHVEDRGPGSLGADDGLPLEEVASASLATRRR